METSILFEYQEDINLVAMAIKSVLNLEVAIYDDNRTVVVATGGGDHNRVGEQVRGHVISEVYRTGEAVYTFNPGFEELCKPCQLWGKCPEKMGVSFPLNHEGKIIGVIGLTAFTEDQNTNFSHRQEELSNYMEKMADLISNKINIGTLFKKYHSTSQLLEVTIQSMYEGVLAVDREGKVSELNRSAEQILGIKKDEILGGNIEDLWLNFPIGEVLALGKMIRDKEYSCHAGDKKVKVFANITPLVHGNTIIGAVTSFKNLSDVQQFIYSMTSDENPSTLDSIIGQSPALLAAKSQAKRIAAIDSTVIILGESGTGKELFTRSIHAMSNRKNKPFRAINCAAIPEQLLESELFGYTEGSFTGAKKKGKPGKFEMTNGGTIFLDEIGDMPLHLQVKILRVLEDRTVERIGGTEPIPIDVRIIAATNKDLEKMMRNGEFREDLFYRLNVIPVHLPALRERVGDVPILVQHFIKYYNQITGKQIRGLTKEAEQILNNYSWPGNVRELQNAIEYGVHMATGHWIDVTEIPERLRPTTEQNESIGIHNEELLSLKDMEEIMIQRALEKFGTSVEGKRKASDVLGINLATLYRKIARLNEDKTT